MAAPQSSIAMYDRICVTPVSGSISTSAIWQPLGNVEPTFASPTTFNGCGLCDASFLARTCRLIDVSLFGELNRPSLNTTCEGSTSSCSAAKGVACAISFKAASLQTLPAPTIAREPPDG